MKIIAPWGECELAPMVKVWGLLSARSEPIPGLWALPGGLQVTEQDLWALCRRNGWTLVNPDWEEAKATVNATRAPSQGGSSLENVYCT